MAKIRFLAFSTYMIVTSKALAQVNTIQQAVWTNPSGLAADFSLSVISGTSIELAWNAYDPVGFVSIGLFDTTHAASLWVIDNANAGRTSFNQLLKANVNLTIKGTLKWDTVIPGGQLERTDKYMLVFKPGESEGSSVTDTQIASPGILIKKAAQLPEVSSTMLSSSRSLSPSIPTISSSTLQPTTPSAISSTVNRQSSWTSSPTSTTSGQNSPQTTFPTVTGTTSSSPYSQSPNPSPTSPASQQQQRARSNTKTIAAAITSAIAGFIILLCLPIFLYRRHQKSKSTVRKTKHKANQSASPSTGRTYSDLSPTTPSFFHRLSHFPVSKTSEGEGSREDRNGSHVERQSWWRRNGRGCEDRSSGMMSMSETIKGQRTYYSPDDIVIYPSSELGFCAGWNGKGRKEISRGEWQ